MATKYVVQTFADIVSAVREELGEDANDTTITNRIKRDINFVYLQEVCPDKNWWWLTKTTEVQAQTYYSTGTASVTSGSVTVTLSSAPSVSYKGAYFSTDGYEEVYRIAAHTASSTTVTLESPYTGDTDSAATFKIWESSLPLPADCSRTIEIAHSFMSKPLEGIGPQEMRRLVTSSPKTEGRPEYYCTGNLVDPDPYEAVGSLPATTYRSSSGLVRSIVFASTLGASESVALLAPGDKIEVTGAGNYMYNGIGVVCELTTTTATNDTIKYTMEGRKTESSTADTGITVKKAAPNDKEARYRELFIYPYLLDEKTTLYVDYALEPSPLINDTDEPLIPLEDRNILVYGALSRQWVKVRDEETATRNSALYANKLAKMAGRIEDSIDFPKLQLSPLYLQSKRRVRKRYG